MPRQVPARTIAEVRQQRVHAGLIFRIGHQIFLAVILLGDGIVRPDRDRAEGIVIRRYPGTKDSIIENPNRSRGENRYKQNSSEKPA